ncbi:hypothetical protein [Pseudonocardia sp. GCM10023141]|uniref:hypothetical protein n=1 Tax=Pseudonocardia sp. GCM10023141 TaxID=3252653 RepID=UPI00361F070E
MTRADADAARSLLAQRHADDQEPEPTVTAQEWLDAERAARRDDDDHRPITDTDLHTGDELPDDHTAATTTDTRPLTPAPTDVREVAAAEPQPVAEDDVRVPTAEDVDHSLDRAQRALDEITARELLDVEEDDHHSALGTADTGRRRRRGRPRDGSGRDLNP